MRARKKIKTMSIIFGVIAGFIFGVILANTSAANLDNIIGGSFTVIGGILGGICGGVAGAIGGLLVIGAIGFGLAKAFASAPILGAVLVTIVFGAIGFGVAALIIDNKELNLIK